jgi:hypothetical protein
MLSDGSVLSSGTLNTGGNQLSVNVDGNHNNKFFK